MLSSPARMNTMRIIIEIDGVSSTVQTTPATEPTASPGQPAPAGPGPGGRGGQDASTAPPEVLAATAIGARDAGAAPIFEAPPSDAPPLPFEYLDRHAPVHTPTDASAGAARGSSIEGAELEMIEVADEDSLEPSSPMGLQNGVSMAATHVPRPRRAR
jgi:hypothetical protein